MSGGAGGYRLRRLLKATVAIKAICSTDVYNVGVRGIVARDITVVWYHIIISYGTE